MPSRGTPGPRMVVRPESETWTPWTWGLDDDTRGRSPVHPELSADRLGPQKSRMPGRGDCEIRNDRIRTLPLTDSGIEVVGFQNTREPG